MKRTLLLSAVFALWAVPARANDGPIPDALRLDPGFGINAQVEGSTRLRLQCRGDFMSISARQTNVPDEFLVRADDPDLQKIAANFEATFHFSDKTLSCKRGYVNRSLRMGQNRVQGGGPNAGTEGAELQVSAQEIGGVPYIPLTALEEFLDTRVTVRPGNQVYIEPLIRNVTVENNTLKIESSSGVSYKSFFLKNPNRYVIDVRGGVLDTPGPTVEDDNIGSIRLGQFTLAPAVSRIVVPMKPGMRIKAPLLGEGRSLYFAMTAPTRQALAVESAHISQVELQPGPVLRISADRPLQYQEMRFPDHRTVVDIKGAVLNANPKNEWTLDSNLAASMRVCQYTPLPNPIVRVVIETKGTSGVDLRPDGNALMLSVLDHPVETPIVKITPAAMPPDESVPVVGGAHETIVIDPGHGGSDTGAPNKKLGLTEASVTLDISRRLATLLRARGWNVVLTRNSDVDVTFWGSSARAELSARAEVGNKNHADLFVSIHCNASVSPSSAGTSIHYYKRSDYTLAKDLHAGLIGATGRQDRGLQANRFYVLVHTKMPAVLVETAFITNPTEGGLLNDPDYRQHIAEGLAQGLGVYAAHTHSAHLRG